jgi:WD40 repeat protein
MGNPPTSSTRKLSHYSLRKKLGAGAMGEVWLAHDKLLDRDVAIKLLHAGVTNQALMNSFLREARAAAKLNHPNTVTIHQIGKAGDDVFIAMEYVNAGSLADELQAKGALPWREATQAIRDAAAGLQAAHEMGLIHRDIKPSNLMRSARGLVKVADFGLAKAGDGQSEITQTQPGMLLGSPAYMSPEQCRGERADSRSDLYSLICTYYQLLTRQLPFVAAEATAAMYQHCHEPFPDPRGKGFKLPDGVSRILVKGGKKKPQERYQTAAELLADLDVVLQTPEASHTYDGKDSTTKPGLKPVGAGISFQSILRGKGVMGKTSWALAVVAVAWTLIAVLSGPGAGGPPAPVPSASDQYRAEKIIKDVFKDGYAKQGVSDRDALAQKLIDEGRQTNNNLPAKFVLFREARTLAAGAGDFDLAYKAVDETAAAFAVDAMDLKTGALVTAAPSADTPDANLALARACLKLIDTAVAAEQYRFPTRLLPIADAAAGKAQDVAMVAEVRIKGLQVQELRQDFDRRKFAAATLANTPNDPAANSAMGRSLCFIKGTWDAGLPMLVKGSDATLKDLATRELAPPANGATQLQLADAWWDLAQHQSELAKAQVQRHAADWYAKAWPQLAGLDKAKAESRMPNDIKAKLTAAPTVVTVVPTVPHLAPSPQGVAPNAAATVVDVLKLIDVDKEPLAGRCTKKDGAIAFDGKSLVQIPFHTPAEYDFRVVFSPADNTGHGITLVLSKGPRLFLFTISAGAYWDAFGLVNGASGDMLDNPTRVVSAVRPALGRKYTIVVRVRNDGVEGFLDGKLVASHKTDYSDLSNWVEFKSVQPGTLALSTYDAPATIYSAEVIEVTKAAAGADGPRVVDLMPLIDPTADAVRGTWHMDAGLLQVDPTVHTCLSLALPYTPSDSEEYDLHVGFSFRNKGDEIQGLVSHGGKRFNFVVAQSGTFGFEKVAGKRAQDDATSVHVSELAIGPHDFRVGIRNKSLELVLDGKQVIQYATDYSDLDEDDHWQRPDNAIGIGSWQGGVDFRTIEVKAISGGGTVRDRSAPRPPTHMDGMGHRIIDLMPLIDPNADALKGAWHRVGDKLHVDPPAQPAETLLRLPYLPGNSEEYDLHVGIVFRHGEGVVRGLASHLGKRFGIMVDSQGNVRLEDIAGNDNRLGSHDTPGGASNGRDHEVQHDLVIRVRSTRPGNSNCVDACLDGRQVIEYPGGYDKLSENENWKRPDDALGIGATLGDVDFGPIEVVEVRGSGTLLRAPIGTSTPPATGEDPRRQTPGLVRAFTMVSQLQAAEVAPGGRQLCFVTRRTDPHDGGVLNVETGKEIRCDTVQCCKLLPDAKHFLADWDGWWKICDLETGKDSVVDLGPNPSGNGAVSTDGSRLLSPNRSGNAILDLYDLNTGAKIRELPNHGAVFSWSWALSPGGKTYSGRTDDHVLHLWDAGNGNELWHVATDGSEAPLSFSTDGKLLLRRSRDKGVAVELYNAQSGDLLAECGGWSGWSSDAALSSDGKFLVAGCDDPDAGLRLFRLDGDDKKLRSTLLEWPTGAKEIGPVNSAAISQDNRRVLVGCRNHKVRLYDVETGQELADFDHGGEVLLVGFASDGRYAVSGNDTSVRVWRLP